MSNNLIDEAEFLLHLAEENSITRLRNLLQGATAERTLPILRRINQFYNGNNAEVLLSLAIRSFHQGQDDEAICFARRARELKPDDHQVLRVALFFAAARGETEDAKIVSQRLLNLYPHDEWARTMDSKLRQEEIGSSLSNGNDLAEFLKTTHHYEKFLRINENPRYSAHEPHCVSDLPGQRQGETLSGSAWGYKPGGKGGNQAVAAVQFGAQTFMIGRVGNDDFGKRLLSHLRDAGVDAKHILTDSEAGSGMSAAIIDAEGDYGAVIVSGANLRLSNKDLEEAREVIL